MAISEKRFSLAMGAKNTVTTADLDKGPTLVKPVLTKPEVIEIMEDSVRLLRDQLRVYQTKPGLDTREIGALTKMMDALVKMRKEERESRKEDPDMESLEDLWAFVEDLERRGLRPGKEGA